MHMQPSFWSHFEESAIAGQPTNRKTMTRQREEPDQRATPLLGGTKTKTLAREEDDQDPDHSGFSAIPRWYTATMKTLTETREEPDQAESLQAYASVPLVSVTR